MPRTAREKSYESIYHIMVRSISEVDLFKNDEDKVRYLQTVKNYQDKYNFKVYAYCLMDNHAHFIIDANGADISRIMHGINQSYAQNFNKIHNRHGHLFQDRFKSKIVDRDEYILTLSGYIHRNVEDLPYAKNNIKEYRFSSLRAYLGLEKDRFEILEEDFIMSMFGNNSQTSRENYLEFLNNCSDESIKLEVEFVGEKTEYRSERRILERDKSPEEVKEFLAEELQTAATVINLKYNRRATHFKALCVLFLSSFCNMSQKEICNYMGNITQSRISTLCKLALKLIKDDYQGIINKFIQEHYKCA
ncbi:Transposase IS200 like protein [Caloramator mitchellensis]|uniref:Transposase IS200 like protein n=1 Tax=Caloramator mitchellensis TaxID=908809 RepID=A0A0R3JV55_CALMK|nr:transposase [Caloramator mitchellensis]KRQ87409.1 Transposase IS200 like protein [Caloramator mitchellensis]